MKRIVLFLVAVTFGSTASADLYLEVAIESGGDELIDTNVGDAINAGGGIKFAVGIQNQIGAQQNNTITLAFGYMFDTINASDGTADFDVFTFDAIYNLGIYRHRLGVGASYHADPHYEDKVDGFAPYALDFDDSLGFVMQYAYKISDNAQFGLRYTDMDYEINNLTVDASSFGLFLSGSF